MFHSVPYEKKDKSTLEWWEYDKLGTKASLGCVRLKVEDAKWIYDNCIPGTKIEFYSDANPGPLGKPTAKKITSHTEVRNWDPTDPDANNPWRNYSENKNKPEETNTVTNNTVTNNEITNNDITNNSSIDGNQNKENLQNNLQSID